MDRTDLDSPDSRPLDPETNIEQADGDQAQDVADDALGREADPAEDSEHGGRANPAAIIPDDVPDLLDTMNQMVTSGIIDNGAFAGEPMMDDEEDIRGDTEADDDAANHLGVSRGRIDN